MPFSFLGYSGSLGDRLGWTQEEIGEVIGIEHNRVSQLLLEMAELPKLTKKQTEEGGGYTPSSI
jgi:hypothetical protein